MVNNAKNTTLKLPKELRDKLAVIKFKYHMSELHEVIQLLLNVADLQNFELSNSGINAGEQTKEVVNGILPNSDATLYNQ